MNIGEHLVNGRNLPADANSMIKERVETLAEPEGIEDCHQSTEFDLAIDVADQVVDLSNLVPLNERGNFLVKKKAIALLTKLRSSSSDHSSSLQSDKENRLYPQVVDIPDACADLDALFQQSNPPSWRRMDDEEYLERKLQNFDNRRPLATNKPLPRSDSIVSHNSNSTTRSENRKPAAFRQESFRGINKGLDRAPSRGNLGQHAGGSFRDLQRDGSFRQHGLRSSRESSFRNRPGAHAESSTSASARRHSGKNALLQQQQQLARSHLSRAHSSEQDNSSPRDAMGNFSETSYGSRRQPAHFPPSQLHHSSDDHHRELNQRDYREWEQKMHYHHQQQQLYPQREFQHQQHYHQREQQHYCQQQYRSHEPPMQAQQQRMEIEITPGVFCFLRGAGETMAAVESGRILRLQCFCCSTNLLCIDTAQYVLCPECKVVSPTTEHSSAGGNASVGLGLRENERPQQQQRQMRDFRGRSAGYPSEQFSNNMLYGRR